MGGLSRAALALALSVAVQPPGLAVAAERQPTAILIEADSGRALREAEADASRPLGSLGQLMLLLVSLEQAELGLLRLQVPVTLGTAAVSPGAGGFRVPLHAEKAYLFSDLLKAVAVASATDAAVAAAEAMAGSLPACLDLMNARALRLGMRATHYTSVGGIDGGDATTLETTTARDQARLAQALLHHPTVLEWASATGVPFDEGAVVLRNGNQLLGAVRGVDGLQASSVRANQSTSYSVVATARRDALRLVVIVLDAPDTASRYSTAADLLEWGFAHYERIELVRHGEPVNLPVRVLHGSVPQLTPIAGGTLSLLRQRNDERDLQLRYQLPVTVDAPLKRHQAVGEVIVEEKGQLIAVIPLLSPTSVSATGVLDVDLP
ncbi:MAG: D-alanyl-D-alanine carboxypeptidase [Deltaproteobacteria bacterium]|nr:D-alanyl-D-alanine carboxypeptidase [Deltaproteobacteria bacterium]